MTKIPFKITYPATILSLLSNDNSRIYFIYRNCENIGELNEINSPNLAINELLGAMDR